MLSGSAEHLTKVGSQRVVIYPCYINSKKTIAEGRRIPVEKGKESSAPSVYGSLGPGYCRNSESVQPVKTRTQWRLWTAATTSSAQQSLRSLTSLLFLSYLRQHLIL